MISRNRRLPRFLGLAALVVFLFIIHEIIALIAVGGIALVLLRRRITPEHRRLLLALAVSGLMLSLAGIGFESVIVLIALTYLLLRYATEPLSRFIARLRHSIRWKFEVALSSIAALFLIVSLLSLGAMDFMHNELHEIQELGPGQTAEVLAAVNELEDTRHTLLSTLTPIFSIAGLLMAAALGAAMARSVIDPVRSMGQVMHRMASGDFSQPLRIENRDELGDLAGRINQTAEDLARLQEATLAEERAHALQERIKQVTLAQEEERRRISRELHDGLGPSLAAISNRLRACRSLVRDDSERAERELVDIADGLTGHIQEIRQLTHDLRPLALDQLGLIEALRQHVERFSQETAIPASFKSSGAFTLNPLAEVTVLRVVQESLGNVQKHANASRVEVKLQVTDFLLEVGVRDNGRGFDPGAMASGTIEQGLGLVSMRERAELLGGSLSVESGPGDGCRVMLQIPL